MDEERVGRSRAILRRWKKDVLGMLLMCDLKERVGSMIMPRLILSIINVQVSKDCLLIYLI